MSSKKITDLTAAATRLISGDLAEISVQISPGVYQSFGVDFDFMKPEYNDNEIVYGDNTNGSNTSSDLTFDDSSGLFVLTGNGQIYGLNSTAGTFGLEVFDSTLNKNFYVEDDGKVSSRLGYWIGGSLILSSSGSVNVWIGSGAGGAKAGSNGMVCIGDGACQNVVLGVSEGVHIGKNNSQLFDFSSYNINIGSNSTFVKSDAISTIGIGTSNRIYQDHTLVIGDNFAGALHIGKAFLGYGQAQTPGNLGSFSLSVAGVLGEDLVSGTPAAGTGVTDGSAATSIFYIDPALSTGTGLSGNIVVRYCPSGASSNNQNTCVGNDAWTFYGPDGTLIASDGINIQTGTTTGTKIANSVSQKLGFWNKTPVVQPAAANQAALTNSTGGSYDGTLVDVGAIFSQTNINNNFTDVYTLLTEIRTALVNTGIIKGAA